MAARARRGRPRFGKGVIVISNSISNNTVAIIIACNNPNSNCISSNTRACGRDAGGRGLVDREFGESMSSEDAGVESNSSASLKN